jgi:hypothetical protein
LRLAMTLFQAGKNDQKSSKHIYRRHTKKLQLNLCYFNSKDICNILPERVKEDIFENLIVGMSSEMEGCPPYWWKCNYYR